MRRLLDIFRNKSNTRVEPTLAEPVEQPVPESDVKEDVYFLKPSILVYATTDRTEFKTSTSDLVDRVTGIRNNDIQILAWSVLRNAFRRKKETLSVFSVKLPLPRTNAYSVFIEPMVDESVMLMGPPSIKVFLDPEHYGEDRQCSTPYPRCITSDGLEVIKEIALYLSAPVKQIDIRSSGAVIATLEPSDPNFTVQSLKGYMVENVIRNNVTDD